MQPASIVLFLSLQSPLSDCCVVNEQGGPEGWHRHDAASKHVTEVSFVFECQLLPGRDADSLYEMSSPSSL